MQLSEAAGTSQRLVNAQIRCTMIRNWLRDGHSYLDVMKITRQKALATVQHYDPMASTSKRLTMGSSNWGLLEPKPKVDEDEEKVDETFQPQPGSSKTPDFVFKKKAVNKENVCQNIEKVYVDVLYTEPLDSVKKVAQTFPCNHCDDELSSIEELERHLLHVHGKIEGNNGVETLEVVQLEPASETTFGENLVDYQISLEPFDDVAEKRKSIHFNGQNDGVKRKLENSEEAQTARKRKPLVQVSENQMDFFKNPIAAADFFTDWQGEVKEDKRNQQKTIDQAQTLLSRDQFLRAKELQIREKAQDAQIKTSYALMAMLERFEARLHPNEKSNEVIKEANEMVNFSTDENQQ